MSSGRHLILTRHLIWTCHLIRCISMPRHATSTCYVNMITTRVKMTSTFSTRTMYETVVPHSRRCSQDGVKSINKICNFMIIMMMFISKLRHVLKILVYPSDSWFLGQHCVSTVNLIFTYRNHIYELSHAHFLCRFLLYCCKYWQRLC